MIENPDFGAALYGFLKGNTLNEISVPEVLLETGLETINFLERVLYSQVIELDIPETDVQVGVELSII